MENETNTKLFCSIQIFENNEKVKKQYKQNKEENDAAKCDYLQGNDIHNQPTNAYINETDYNQSKMKPRNLNSPSNSQLNRKNVKKNALIGLNAENSDSSVTSLELTKEKSSAASDDLLCLTPNKRLLQKADISTSKIIASYDDEECAGEGIPLGEIEHVAEFIRCNSQNEEWKKLVHKTIYGTIGSKQSRMQDIRKFCGFGSQKIHRAIIAAEDRLMKYSNANLHVMADVLNLKAEVPLNRTQIIEMISNYISKPVDQGKSIVKPYDVKCCATHDTKVQPAETPHPTRRRASRKLRQEKQKESTLKATDSKPKQHILRATSFSRNKAVVDSEETEASTDGSC